MTGRFAHVLIKCFSVLFIQDKTAKVVNNVIERQNVIATNKTVLRTFS